jgi:uncharacterized protein involved in exopolysaccharide biosynthesis
MHVSPFDPLELLIDLRRRWPVMAMSCGLALLLAALISFLLPKRYTATAEVLIQAPGGNDPRAATAISPVYLESLKSYERLASSDTLFQRAFNRVQGAAGDRSGPSIESIKKSILRVSKPANTAVLEISATMGDPRKAQALAQYVAEQTVEASLSIDSQSESEMTREFRSQLDAAAGRLARTRQAQESLGGSEPLDSLDDQLANNAELKLNIEKDLSQARTELAGYIAEQHSLPGAAGEDAESLHRLILSAQARVANLESQQRDVDARLRQQGAQVQEWKDHREALQADRKAAQTAFETSSARLNEAVASAQFRGERLRMIDPGIVPQEPSSPNVPLNLAASLILSAVGSLIYLAMTSSYYRSRRGTAETRTQPVFSFRG